MKKNKIINLILLIAISFLFYNCNEESLEQNQELSEAAKVLSGIKEENITLDEIKNDLYLNNIAQKASKKIKPDGNTAKNGIPDFFNLNLSNQVKKYTVNGYTSYTIPIINDFENSYIFQNIVIEKDVLRDAAYLVTYYPDDNYKESIKKHLLPNDNIDYTGSKTIEYLYYKRKVNIEEKTALSKTGKSTDLSVPDENIDEPITICVETYRPKKCTAGGNHSPGEACSGTGGQRAGWVVSMDCTTITQRPEGPAPGPGPGCSGCVGSAGGSSGGGNFIPK